MCLEMKGTDDTDSSLDQGSLKSYMSLQMRFWYFWHCPAVKGEISLHRLARAFPALIHRVGTQSDQNLGL